jgi:hypothetical protein
VARTPAAFIGTIGRVYRTAVYCETMDETHEITVLQLPKFKASATELIGADGIDAIASYLSNYPNAGVVIPCKE